jgi:membrane protein implicated in regulation of membrane protease activity
MDKRILCAVCALFLVPATAGAYVGPGAGLSLLGALWALLVALGTALVFVIAWPVRRMLKRKREDRAEAPPDDAQRRVEPEEETPSSRRPVTRPEGDEPLPSKRP